MKFNSNPRLSESLDPLPFEWPQSENELSESLVNVTTSQLKPQTRSGVFLWWSDQIPTWVHPDDVEIATRLVPGNRVFRRESCDNASDRELGYSTFHYGPECFRGKPSLWLEIEHRGFELGDLVEIKSRQGRLRPRIAVITSVLWNRNSLSINYVLSVNGIRLQRPYAIDELRPAIQLGRHLSFRERKLAARRESMAD